MPVGCGKCLKFIETNAPERSCGDQISVKSSKGIVSKRGQKHLLKWQSFPCASVVHIIFYISVRTQTKRTFRTKNGPSWSWSYGSWIYKYLWNQCL